MSSKLTELTESSPSAPPPSVLCGSGILHQLASPCSMASPGHFDPGQTYDGCKAVEVLDPACTGFLAKGKDCFQNFNQKSSKFHFCFFGKKPCCCPGSAVPISRINTEGVVKIRRRIANSPPDPHAEDSDELDGEEVEVVDNPVGHQSSTCPSQPPAKRFQSRLIPSTPRNFQPTLATIPTSPSSSHTRPAINSAVRPSPIQQSRASPIVTSKQLQPEVSSSRRREKLSPLPFPTSQVF
ncbi:hypothetical protein O181_098570 [Austropuccinia psidii MF-1]|uniref:Uncharacterized protein n=1 Tax=Austropuccinia psidii MF-1 TaxID=1389203 RepID=A0A9Q3J9H0_9BASI|nr:hypothetical protein [Austropuccinia psidii MF-1]